MVTKKVTSDPEPEPVEDSVPEPDVCEGCAALRVEFEAFRELVINNAQGM